MAHGGEKVDFTMTALRSFRSCLKRQVNEAVRISSSQADILLNSKSEWRGWSSRAGKGRKER